MTKVKYSKEILESIVKQCESLSQVLRILGLKARGSNYKTLQKYIELYSIDIAHLKGKSIHAGKEYIPFENLRGKTQIRERLIKLLGYSCKHCGISNWNNKPITLEVEHVDGNPRNNSRKNLTLLCPNCHSQTSTFRNRKRLPSKEGMA
jgi:hypothetical protein